MATNPSNSLLLAKELVDTLQQQYDNIDAQRLYVTGLSMGGYGAWEAGERWPDYFAADVPLAGAGDPTHASALVHLPIWAFYGAQDTTVPTTGTTDMIQAIKNAGGQPRCTVFPNAAHGVWAPGQAYSPALFTWLFSQKRTTT
jgi:predicted peptidase